MGNDEFREFLERAHPTEAARRLLGCTLVAPDCRVQIVEAEGYGGSDDPGSHGYRGMTRRNEPMFGPPGWSYVYFTYGNHWMFNVSCRPDGECGAVLLRAAFPLSGEEAMAYRRPKAQDRFGLLSGPGKLAAAVGATGEHTGLDLLGNKGPFRLVVGEERTEVLVSKRIGIAKGRGDEMPWRFVDANLREWASRKS